MTPRFLLAKYAPDLARMEPRNIGVIVWWKGELRARFLDISDADIITDEEGYERWVAFWHRTIDSDTIRPDRGLPVSKSEPDCLDALVSTQKGNYFLVDAGELLQKIGKRDRHAATEYRFGDLVAVGGHKIAERASSFRRQCDRVLSDAGVEFIPRKAIECTWNGVPRHLHPDYYVRPNGHAAAILRRAKLSSEASINHSALLLDILLDHGVVDSTRCLVLFRAADVGSATADEDLALFEKMCGVVDVQSNIAVSQVASVRGDDSNL